MKIEDRLANYLSLLNSHQEKPASRASENSSLSAAPGGDAVSVELSAAATRPADDTARLEKLNAIRQKLAEGSYNISGKDVAEKMLKVLEG